MEFLNFITIHNRILKNLVFIIINLEKTSSSIKIDVKI